MPGNARPTRGDPRRSRESLTPKRRGWYSLRPFSSPRPPRRLRRNSRTAPDSEEAPEIPCRDHRPPSLLLPKAKGPAARRAGRAGGRQPRATPPRKTFAEGRSGLVDNAHVPRVCHVEERRQWGVCGLASGDAPTPAYCLWLGRFHLPSLCHRTQVSELTPARTGEATVVFLILSLVCPAGSPDVMAGGVRRTVHRGDRPGAGVPRHSLGTAASLLRAAHHSIASCARGAARPSPARSGSPGRSLTRSKHLTRPARMSPGSPIPAEAPYPLGTGRGFPLGPRLARGPRRHLTFGLGVAARRAETRDRRARPPADRPPMSEAAGRAGTPLGGPPAQPRDDDIDLGSCARYRRAPVCRAWRFSASYELFIVGRSVICFRRRGTSWPRSPPRSTSHKRGLREQ